MLDYTNVTVNRSEVSVITVAVPPWEVPVLMAVNGEDRCIIGGTIQTRRDTPDAQSEYDRLDLKYGIDMNSGQSFVGLVYGVGQLGVGRLADEIKKAEIATKLTEAGMAGDAEVVSDEDLASLGLLPEATVAAGGAVPISE